MAVISLDGLYLDAALNGVAAFFRGFIWIIDKCVVVIKLIGVLLGVMQPTIRNNLNSCHSSEAIIFAGTGSE